MFRHNKNVIIPNCASFFETKNCVTGDLFAIPDNPGRKMIRNAIISSSSILGKNNSQMLKAIGVSAINQHQKREQKTMSVVERDQPEKLPGSAFGWQVTKLLYRFLHVFNSNILGSNRTGLIGPSLVSMTCSIGDVKDLYGHWLSVLHAAPSRWCTLPLRDTTWIVMVSSSEPLLDKLMSLLSLELWRIKWLQLCARSTIKCQSLVGSSRWEAVPTAVDTITIRIQLFADATESSQSIFTFLDVHQQLRHFSTASSNSKRRSNAWRLCKCGTESKFLISENLVGICCRHQCNKSFLWNQRKNANEIRVNKKTEKFNCLINWLT